METSASPDGAAITAEAVRRPSTVRANPTYGSRYWVLGCLAAWPSVAVAAVFAAPLVRLPRVGQLPQGLLLAAMLALLALGGLVGHVLHYPAWSQTWVVSLVAVGLLAPATMQHGAALAGSAADPDPVVAIAVLATWLLMVGAFIVTGTVAVMVGRYAPSYSGVSMTVAPLLLGWALAMPGRFRDDIVDAALASTFTLGALTAFIAWIVPAAVRLYLPLFAVAAQAGLFAVLRLGPPSQDGASRPLMLLDVALVLCWTLVAVATPALARWWRRAGWPEVRRRLALAQ